MIGILGAYMLNNWNEGRKQSYQKIELLTLMLNDLAEDKILLEKRIAFDSIRLLGAKIIVDTLSEMNIDLDIVLFNNLVTELDVNNNQKFFENKTQGINLIKNHYLPTEYSFYTQDATFRSFLQSDNIGILKNASLQNKISSYYTLVEYTNRSENFFRDHQTTIFSNYMISDYELMMDMDYFISEKNQYLGWFKRLEWSANFQLQLYSSLSKKISSLEYAIGEELN
jgi:hypothetical protein